MAAGLFLGDAMRQRTVTLPHTRPCDLPWLRYWRRAQIIAAALL